MNFKIDERATLGSILKALKEGNKAEHIAKEIDGISQKPFLKALKEAGYVYSNKAPKGWHYIGEGEEPTEKSIFDYVNSSSFNVKRTLNKEFTSSNAEVASSNVDVIPNSPVIHPQFTRDEVSMIMEMLYEWQQKKVVEQSEVVEEPKQVHERIKAIPKGNKTRKTVVIDKAIGERLDDFCKSERVNKSDVMYLALDEFLRKFEGK